MQFLGSNSRPKPSFRHPPCARTHSAHTKVQLYRFARRAVLVHTTATSSLMCHVITWSGDVSHRSGKDMRKKDEEWPRTGTFCAAWGRISVMQWPIFIGHFGALRLLRFSVHLKIRPVIYVVLDVLTWLCMPRSRPQFHQMAVRTTRLVLRILRAPMVIVAGFSIPT